MRHLPFSLPVSTEAQGELAKHGIEDPTVLDYCWGWNAKILFSFGH